MLSNIRNRKERGFTIIEVLIVLAIAGLILLVVFLAVPALQRNSRNTTRTNDVAGLLGGMSEYVNNNNGSLPATTGPGTAGSTTYTLGATTANEIVVKLGYYGGDGVTVVSGATNYTNTTTEEQVRIVLGAECNGTNAQAGPSRGYVALYTVENDSRQCKES
jgi:prepilin-type N-terminal cleavage/methylation domain-containing protein